MARPNIDWFNEHLASAITGLSDGDPVATWEDIKNNNDLVQDTPANRPVYRAAASDLNGLPGVEFDGVASWMSVLQPSIPAKQTIAFAMVVKLNERATHQVFVSHRADSGLGANVALRSTEVSNSKKVEIFRGGPAGLSSDRPAGQTGLLICTLSTSFAEI